MYTSVHVCRARAAETKRHLKSQKKGGKKTLQNKKSAEKKKWMFPWKSILRSSSQLIPKRAGFPKFCPLCNSSVRWAWEQASPRQRPGNAGAGGGA